MKFWRWFLIGAGAVLIASPVVAAFIKVTTERPLVVLAVVGPVLLGGVCLVWGLRMGD